MTMNSVDPVKNLQFFLFVDANGEGDLTPSTVFYCVDDEARAQCLCQLFTSEYTREKTLPAFRYQSAQSVALEEQVLLEEAIDSLQIYDDPDPTLYEPVPPREVMVRAHYMQRADRWYELLDRRGSTGTSECPTTSSTGTLPIDQSLANLQRALDKHRLMFLYFAGAKRFNPASLGDPWETLDRSEWPDSLIKADDIDSDGAFLFKFRWAFDKFAQAALSQFGFGKGSKPRVLDQNRRLVDVDGGSLPTWWLDDIGCSYLEESSAAILSACRDLVRVDTKQEFRPLVQLARNILHDEGRVKWYSPVLVRWEYLGHLDEAIHAANVADLDLRLQGTTRTSQGENIPGEKNDVDRSSDNLNAAELPDLDNLTPMPAEDRRNSGLILLLLMAQAYYQMLESVISVAGWFTALDLDLNHCYLWTVKNLTNLLKNHEDLKDFPVAFEPLFPDLYPATVGDLEWSDISPEAEGFLATVQKYVVEKGSYEPEENSPGWVLVELFRPSILNAIAKAAAYNKRIQNHKQRLLGPGPSDTSIPKNGGAQDEPLAERAQLVLVAMLELGAIDSDHRKPTEEIAARAMGSTSDGNSLKTVVADLRVRKLIKTKEGRGGGCWLTESGRHRAEAMAASLN